MQRIKRILISHQLFSSVLFVLYVLSVPFLPTTAHAQTDATATVTEPAPAPKTSGESNIPFKYKCDQWSLKNAMDPEKRTLSMTGNVVLNRVYVSKDDAGRPVTGTYILKAQQVDYVFSTGIATAEGKVSVTDGKASIKSKNALYNYPEHLATFTGDVYFTWGPGSQLSEMNMPGAKAKLDITFNELGQVDSASGTGGEGVYFPAAGEELNLPGGTSASKKKPMALKPSTN